MSEFLSLLQALHASLAHSQEIVQSLIQHASRGDTLDPPPLVPHHRSTASTTKTHLTSPTSSHSRPNSSPSRPRVQNGEKRHKNPPSDPSSPLPPSPLHAAQSPQTSGSRPSSSMDLDAVTVLFQNGHLKPSGDNNSDETNEELLSVRKCAPLFSHHVQPTALPRQELSDNEERGPFVITSTHTYNSSSSHRH